MFLSYSESLLHTFLLLSVEMATWLDGFLVWHIMAILLQDLYSVDLYKLTQMWFNSVGTPWI